VSTRPSARVLLDSVSPVGHRVTTMEVTLHRFVFAEFNTHRAFSRNSASSRAIPLQRMIRRAVEDPALPVSWPAERRGMQGGAELEAHDVDTASRLWLRARDYAVRFAETLGDIDVHKSVVNRLLEPFLWHTVIVTSDPVGLNNFFEQRCSPLAQPELRVAAEAMRDAYAASTPQELDYGEWHTPLIQPDEVDFYGPLGEDMEEQRRYVSAARAARVSYLTHAGTRDVEEDLRLYERLVHADPPHWSPLEHVCTPDPVAAGREIGRQSYRWVTGNARPANLRGWVQLRHVVAERGV